MLFRTRGLAVTGVLLAPGLAVAGPPTMAQTRGPTVVVVQPDSVRPVRITPAEREDLTRVAKENGINLNEAIQRWGWQTSFAEIVTKLEVTHSSAYSGSAITGRGKGAQIAFKGAIPPEAFQLARTMPVPVTLVGGKGFSEKELNDATVKHFYRVTDDAEVDTAEGGYDIDTGRIDISAVPRRRLNPGQRAALLRRLRPLRSSAGSPIRLHVKLVDTIDADPKVLATRPRPKMYGGGFLNGNGICTAGFTVTRSRTTKGIATAHHCAWGNHTFRYYPHNHGGRNTTIHRRNSHGGRLGDFSWYTTGSYQAVPYFYATPNRARDVRRYLSPTRNQRLCNYGRMTQAKCYAVLAPRGQCVRYRGLPRYCNLAAMVTVRTKDGDSGGPFYWGNNAYGILSGEKRIGRGLRDLFSRASDMYEALGVSVWLR